jgi:hypothetical protein
MRRRLQKIGLLKATEYLVQKIGPSRFGASLHEMRRRLQKIDLLKATEYLVQKIGPVRNSPFAAETFFSEMRIT